MLCFSYFAAPQCAASPAHCGAETLCVVVTLPFPTTTATTTELYFPWRLQGVGGGLPDSALPAERHLVLRPDVLVCSISASGLPFLLPQHGSGPSYYNSALYPGQKGLSEQLPAGICGEQLQRCLTQAFIPGRVRKTTADACDSRSAASLLLPARQTR